MDKRTIIKKNKEFIKNNSLGIVKESTGQNLSLGVYKLEQEWITTNEGRKLMWCINHYKSGKRPQSKIPLPIQ